MLFLASSQFLTNYKVKKSYFIGNLWSISKKKSNFSKLTGKIYEIIEYSTFSSITNFQTVIFHTVSSTKSIPRNSQFLATRSDLWGRINCELRGIPVYVPDLKSIEIRDIRHDYTYLKHISGIGKLFIN